MSTKRKPLSTYQVDEQYLCKQPFYFIEAIKIGTLIPIRVNKIDMNMSWKWPENKIHFSRFDKFHKTIISGVIDRQTIFITSNDAAEAKRCFEDMFCVSSSTKEYLISKGWTDDHNLHPITWEQLYDLFVNGLMKHNIRTPIPPSILEWR